MAQNSGHSAISDEELDGIMLQILNSFPSFGQRMIDGHLKYLGVIGFMPYLGTCLTSPDAPPYMGVIPSFRTEDLYFTCMCLV